MKWGELTRSEVPIKWKEILDRVMLTHSRLNIFIHQEIERRNKENRMFPMFLQDEENVDMDEVNKTEAEDSDIAEDADEEDEDDDIDEDDEEDSE